MSGQFEDFDSDEFLDEATSSFLLEKGVDKEVIKKFIDCRELMRNRHLKKQLS